jgi:hypothetical protein
MQWPSEGSLVNILFNKRLYSHFFGIQFGIDYAVKLSEYQKKLRIAWVPKKHSLNNLSLFLVSNKSPFGLLTTTSSSELVGGRARNCFSLLIISTGTVWFYFGLTLRHIFFTNWRVSFLRLRDLKKVSLFMVSFCLVSFCLVSFWSPLWWVSHRYRWVSLWS